MDLLKPFLPVNFKPVAVVIEAQSDEEPLPALLEEVDHIKARFQELEFEVLHLKNPSAADISNLFSKTNPIYDRLTVFHFAGHSDESGMKLPSLNGDKDDTEQLFFRGLAGFLSRVSSLRLVFINGCRSYGFVDDYPKSNRRSDRNVGLIVSNSTIPDQIAKDFSIDFYSEWTKSEEFKVTIQDAFDHAKSSIESRGAPDVVRSESSVDTQDTQFPWSIANNPKSTLPNCYSAAFFAKLVGKENYVDSREFSRWWIAAFGAAIVIAMVSLWFAYFSSFSSPAFQASFGYGLTRHDVVERAPKKQKPNDHQFFISEKDQPTIGAYIELFRVVFGIAAIWMSFLLFGPPFEFRHLTKSQLASLLIFWIVVLVGLLYYNLSMAPRGLATDWKDRDNQWLSTIVWNEEGGAPSLAEKNLFDAESRDTESNSYFCLDETLWKKAGDTWEKRFPAFKSLLKSKLSGSENGSEGEVLAKAGIESFHEREMYFLPYYAYSFYSMVLFGFVAMLLLFCVTIHTYKAANLILFLVRATKGSKSVAAFKNEQKKIVNVSHRLLYIALRRYSVFLCMLLIFLDFEVSLGFLTLASMAKYLTLFAIGLIFLMGASLLGTAHWRLTEAFISNDLDLVQGLRRPNEIWEDGWVRGACWLIPIVLAHVWYMLGHTL